MLVKKQAVNYLKNGRRLPGDYPPKWGGVGEGCLEGAAVTSARLVPMESIWALSSYPVFQKTLSRLA